MTKKFMKIDLHTHAVGHRYVWEGRLPEQLSDKDKADIRGLIENAITRGLDALGITDHDFALSGLWGASYAEAAKLPIRVIPGCECELYYQGAYIHVLALNLKKALSYTAFTPLPELVEQIHAQGAISVLAHPMCYSENIYHSIKNLVQGVEYRNGEQERRGERIFTGVLDADDYRGLRLHSSDYHFPSQQSREHLQSYTEMEKTEFVRWFG